VTMTFLETLRFALVPALTRHRHPVARLRSNGGRLLLGLLPLLGLPALSSAQTTKTLTIADDVTIRGGGYASTNFSTNATLEVKTSSAASYTRRTLLKFDTQNTIPSGAVIRSAKLYLTLQYASGATSQRIDAFRVQKSFLPREANWLDYRDVATWNSGGGDLSGPFATTYISNAVGSTYAIDLTNLVQRTVNGEFGSRYTRIGLVTTGAITESYRSFYSSRASNSAVRPKLVVSYGTSSTSSATSATSLKVMQWNIHETKGSDGRCDPNRIANTIVKFAPDVVSLNEVPYYHQTYVNDDVPARLESLLEQKTGRAWYRKFINVYGGSWGYGNVILSRYPLTTSSTKILSYKRGVVQVGVSLNGRTVNIFSTHVEYYTASYRPIQIKEAKSFISGFGGPRVIMGDFNTNPGTSDYNLMSSDYADSWPVAKAAGTATAYNGSGNTHGGSRFDYVWFSRTGITLRSVNVPDTRVSGIWPSDHDPVIATFSVN
jgi:endonuclease/exonuclease/phosphatase family metal-dependent hydrolase